MKQLFGSMAMFYTVTSGAGGGGAMTPSSFVGAAPQISFGTAANQGFMWSDGATTGVTLSHALTNVAGVDTATQVYGGRIRLNSSTDFLVIDSQSSGLTPGVAANPTSRLLWAFGSYAQFNDRIIINKAAQTGVPENLLTAQVTDDATGAIQFINNTSTDGVFNPSMVGIAAGTGISIVFRGDITTDSGTNTAMAWNVRTAGGAAVATRPAYQWWNNGAALAQLSADGSQWWIAAPNQLAAGAYAVGTRRTFTVTSGSVVGAMLEGWCNPAGASSATICGSYSYGSSSAANGQNFTGTTGLVGAFGLAQHRGTATATGIASIVAGANVNSGGGTVTNNYGVYVSAQTVGTNNYTLYGAGGIIDNVGIIRAQGNQTPPAGVGCEMSWTGSDSVLRSYDRGGASYQPLRLDGSVVSLRPGGTAAVTVTGSSATYGVGINYRVTLITAAGPTTLAGDDHVGWNPTVSAAGQINLVAAPATGQEVTIQDIKGIAAANNLTISGNGKNINGGTTATTEVIATNFGSRTLWYDGTQWNIKAKV